LNFYRKIRLWSYQFAILGIFTILFISIPGSALASGKSPYESGYDHGCDDAGISDPSEQYINQPEKGPTYHTSEFMDGYNPGVNNCSSDNGSSYYYEEDQYYSEENNNDNSYEYSYEEPKESYRDDYIENTNPNQDFRPLCNLLQVALSNPCDDLVNSDGSLTGLGKNTVWCTLNGAVIGGIASAYIPLPLVLQGLNLLAEPTGCGGLVNTDLLGGITGINKIISQLKNLVL
jgi:hypothetical protein